MIPKLRQRLICHRLVRLAILAALLACAAPCAAQTQHDLGHCALPNTNGGTCSVTFSAGTSSDLIVVRGCVNNGLDSTTPVTDSGSQAYTQQFQTSTSSGWKCFVFYKANSASGITSVTVKESSLSGLGWATAEHWSGMATSSVVDTYSDMTSAGSSPWTGGSATTSHASDVLLSVAAGFYNGSNSNMSASGSWVQDFQQVDAGDGFSFLMSHQVVTSTGSYADTGTDSGGANTIHYAGFVAFKASGAAAKNCTIAAMGAGKC